MNNFLLKKLYDSTGTHYFKKRVQKFHESDIYNTLNGTYLESQFIQAIIARNKLFPKEEQSLINWDPLSHEKCIDCKISHDTIKEDLSIKTGTKRLYVKGKKKGKSFTKISGSRLQNALELPEIKNLSSTWEEGGQNLINNLNNMSLSHNVLSIPCERSESDTHYIFKYMPQLINSGYFIYPPKNQWNVKKKTISCILDNGIIVNLCPSMSWQIWWEIPSEHFECLNEIIIQVDKNATFSYE